MNSKNKLSRMEIAKWLHNAVAAELGVTAATLDPAEPFASYGLSSLTAVSIAGELEELLGCKLPETLLWSYPNIDSLSEQLAKIVQKKGEKAIGKEIKSRALPMQHNEDIAIVSMGCRFPGACNVEAFWELLCQGEDAITEVPPERWNIADFYDENPNTPGKMNTRWGGFIDDVDQFDPGFFGISPHEAARMDPQQRLLLEVTWETLERAGIAPIKTSGSRTGVFIGLSHSDYAGYQMSDATQVDAYAGSGNALSIAANRISYFLNWHGPSLAVDTACSSSLVSVHLACQSLRTGECDAAIAGGANLILRPELSVAFSHANMMSPDGRCKTFDADANGYVRGEGCGLVLLKRLSDAQRDGDPILAVIKAVAVNHDGRTNGLTAPNGLMQQELIEQAWRSAGVPMSQAGYIEAHGTGTPLGDPIEVDALKAALDGEGINSVCYVGSVKTNIGHLEAAAGIAGLIKTALILQHGEIPPHLHLQNLNPKITLEGCRLKIPTSCCALPLGSYAGVSAFGFGGTSAHAVLAPAPKTVEKKHTLQERPRHIFTISARSKAELTAQLMQYAYWLRNTPAELADICHTVNTGRNHFEHRFAAVVETRQQLQEIIEQAADETLTAENAQRVHFGEVKPGVRPKIAFLFPGQGVYYEGMGKVLYETQPIFRDSIDHCAEILKDYLDRPLTSLYFDPYNGESPLIQTGPAQPAIFAFGVSLLALWRSWGIEANAILGQSLGEFAAAYAAGVFPLDDGLRLVAERGRLMQSLPKDWDLLAVFSSQEACADILAPLGNKTELACYNGARLILVGVRKSDVPEFAEVLNAAKIRFDKVDVSHAFHTSQLEPILDEFESLAASVTMRQPGIPLVSNSTGDFVDESMTLDGPYWRKHMRSPVRLNAGVQALIDNGCTAMIEVGAAPFVLRVAQEMLTDGSVILMPTLKKKSHDWDVILESLAKLYTLGAAVDWDAFDAGYEMQRVVLPTYPFRRKRYWFDRSTQALAQDKTSRPNAALADVKVDLDAVAHWFYKLTWETLAPVHNTNDETHGTWLIVAENNAPEVAALTEALQLCGGTVSSASISGNEVKDFFARADAMQGVIFIASTSRNADALCNQLTQLLQSAFARDWKAQKPPRIWVLTHAAQCVTPEDTAPNASHAALWGLGRVASIEMPSLWGGLIDLSKHESFDANVLANLLLNPPPDRQLALRNGQCHAAHLSPAPSLARYATARKLRFRGDAVYIITGGLGDIGEAVAWWMIWQGARNLILVGRRPLPDRSEWDTLDETHPAHEMVKAILGMESLNAQVTYWALDIADADALSHKIQEHTQSGGAAIRGVMHAAGVIEYQPLAQLDEPDFSRALHPKLEGTFSLHHALADHALDFFVLFSSAASLWAGPGQAAYAAANAALDAFAHWRRGQGLPALSINWGPWQDMGMASDTKVKEHLLRQGVQMISQDRGLAILQALMLQDETQVVVLPMHENFLDKVLLPESALCFLSPMRAMNTKKHAETLNITTETGDASEMLAAIFAASVDERINLIEADLRRRVAHILQVDLALSEFDRDLLSLGLDSIMVMQFISDLNAALNIKLYPREVIEQPSLSTLAAHIASEFSGRTNGKVLATSTLTKPNVSPFHFSVYTPTTSQLPRAVFLLSSPRSGSTLLRVMLAGHPQLFCPPELHLLMYENMPEREGAIGTTYLGEGLNRTLMETEGLDAAQSKTLLDELTARGASTAEVYKRIQDAVAPRVLVDKSPSYALAPDSLWRGESLFEGALFIHLVRHPLAVIESFARNRFDKMFGTPVEYPEALAEQVWARGNANVMDFTHRIDPLRHIRVQYESLVGDPQGTMEDICAFLDLSFDPAMLSPYEGNRMRDGLHKASKSVGDPNFETHRGIEKSLVDAWRTQEMDVALSPLLRAVAAELDYDLPKDNTTSRTQFSIPKSYSDFEETIL